MTTEAFAVFPSRVGRTEPRICKRLRSPGINSEESIPSAYVAWRAGTSKRVVVPTRQTGNRFLVSLKDLQIRARYTEIQRVYALERGPMPKCI
jgi:hypothetical protein